MCYIFKANRVVLPPLELEQIIQTGLTICVYVCACIW